MSIEPVKSSPVRLALIGAGQRGLHAYGSYAIRNPDRATFVAVADTHLERRRLFGSAHGIDEALCFEDGLDLIAAPVDIDGVVIATSDRAHYVPAVAAIERGLPILIEKPVSNVMSEVVDLANRAEGKADVTVGHGLRYAPFFSTLKALIDDGRIGDLVAIDHLENVAYFHFAHAFVRGNWRRTDESSPLILSKACHDLDLIRWFAGAPCTSVASVGSLSHFRPENAPIGAPDRCLDGCPARDTCAFYAPGYYLAEASEGLRSAVTEDASPGAILDALKDGPYGRCVYRCDNDVVDHQSTVLGFANGVTASFTLSGLVAEGTRTIKLMGTRGDIRGHMTRGAIELRTYRADGRPLVEMIDVLAEGMHGGGDDRMIESFVTRLFALRQGIDTGGSQTSLRVSLDSHAMAFAAEESRLKGTTVDPRHYVEGLRAKPL